MSPHVAVVGGGIAGLVATRRLLRAGAGVTLVEADPHLGGKLHTSPFAGRLVDEGADSFLVRVPWAVEVCRELGITGELVHPAARNAYVWSRGALRPLPPQLMGVPVDLDALERSGLLSPDGVARAREDLTRPATPPPAGADESIGAVIERRLGTEVLDRLVDPLVGGINAGDARHMSLAAVVPQVDAAARDAGHASLVEACRAQLARATADPTAPLFATPAGGMGRLVDAVAAETVAATLLLGRRVLAVDPLDGAGVHALHLDDGMRVEADAVLLAVPGHAAATLLVPLAPEAAATLGAVEHTSVAMLTLAVRPADIAMALDGSGFLVPRVEGGTVTACSWTSSKWAHLAPEAGDGTVVLRASAGRHGDQRALEQDDDDLVAAALHDLARTMALSGAPTEVRVGRWNEALPVYAPGHLDRIAAMEAALPPTVAVAGMALRGVGVPACIRSGHAAADRLLDATGTCPAVSPADESDEPDDAGTPGEPGRAPDDAGTSGGPGEANVASGEPAGGVGADHAAGPGETGDEPPRRWRRADWGTLGTALGAGVLLALSLPPWGFWPLAFGGLVLLDRLLAGRPAWSRFRRSWLVGLALIGPTMAWLKDMTAPGYLIAVAFYTAGIGLAAAACPPGAGRRLALPGAWLLAEAFRGAWPFGGVPMSILAVGQVGGPLAPVARVGGTLGIALVTVAGGVGLAAALRRAWRSAALGLAVVVGVTALAAVAPHGQATGRSISVGFVQGGGPQGTRAIDTDPAEVFDRHMAASARLPRGLDLVVWPEDVVDTKRYVVDTAEGDDLADLARRKATTLTAGVVEDEGDDRFHNAIQAWDRTGVSIDRYEKVHRVPFGEWVPLRALLEPVAGDSLPSRDAIIGLGPATITTPEAKLAVVVSWEVFFGHRARDGVLHGGQALLNPTNGSSFTSTLVQTQQVASSRLRAIETGRWVVQVAPTGFSAFVTPHGTVLQRTAISRAAVRTQRIELRRGLTVYTRTGDWPWVLTGLVLVAAAWLLDRRDRTGGRHLDA